MDVISLFEEANRVVLRAYRQLIIDNLPKRDPPGWHDLIQTAYTNGWYLELQVMIDYEKAQEPLNVGLFVEMLAYLVKYETTPLSLVECVLKIITFEECLSRFINPLFIAIKYLVNKTVETSIGMIEMLSKWQYNINTVHERKSPMYFYAYQVCKFWPTVDYKIGYYLLKNGAYPLTRADCCSLENKLWYQRTARNRVCVTYKQFYHVTIKLMLMSFSVIPRFRKKHQLSNDIMRRVCEFIL